MIEALKLVFKKWFVWLIAIPPIVGALTFYFPDEGGFGSNIVYWVSGNQYFLMSAILIFAMFSILVENLQNANLRESGKPKKELKPLKASFELETIQKDNYEWVFKIGRYFYPDSTPDIDKFIDAIEMSKTRCVLCKSDIENNVSFGFPTPKKRGARCPNRECELYEKLNLEYEFEDLEKQEEIKFISAVRKNFDKYWKIYCKKYDEATNGKYDEFVDPIEQMWQ